MPIVLKLTEIYKLWQSFLPHFPKTSRYTLGAKIDLLLVEIIEAIVIAIHSSKKTKLPFVRKASIKLDLLKFFLKIAWEIKALDNKKYALLSKELAVIGKMLGGWQRQLKNSGP